MAIVKHLSGKNSSYQSAVDYLTFESDEHNKLLEDKDGFYIPRKNCEILAMNTELDKFSIECAETNKKYNQNQNRNDVKTHHYIISYEPKDNMSVELAREEALKMYEKFFKGHQGVIAIHNDGRNQSNNTHIHIVINSTRHKEMDREKSWIEKPSDWKEGSKHRCTQKFMHDFKAHVMERSKELELKQVDLLSPAKHKVTDKEYRAGQNQEKDQLTKNKLREILTSSADKSKDKADFIDKLKDKGVEVTQRGNTITYVFEKKKFRERALGADYYMDELQKRMGKERVEPPKEVKVKTPEPMPEKTAGATMEVKNVGHAEMSVEKLRFEIESNLLTIDRKQRELDSIKGLFKYKERAELKEQIDRLKEENRQLEELVRQKKSAPGMTQQEQRKAVAERTNQQLTKIQAPEQTQERLQLQQQRQRKAENMNSFFKASGVDIKPQNTDKGRDTSKPIVKQLPKGYSQNQEHDLGNPTEKSKSQKAKDKETKAKTR